jgi:hypothetical protein
LTCIRICARVAHSSGTRPKGQPGRRLAGPTERPAGPVAAAAVPLPALTSFLGAGRHVNLILPAPCSWVLRAQEIAAQTALP